MTDTEQFSQQKWHIALIGLIIFSFFTSLGSVPLFDEDEGAYAEVTREMRESGDFITPRLNGVPFFHKPPLIYWVQAISIAAFGENEFALRLPSVIAAIFWVMCLFAFTRRTVGLAAAWYAAVFLVSGLQTTLIAKAAIADALLNLFISLTCFQIFDYYTNNKRRHIIAAFGFMALGVMTKGFVAVIIPFMASGIFFVLERRFRDWLRAFICPWGWLIFLLIAAPWYLLLYHMYGKAFIDEIYVTQNVNRFFMVFEGHSGSVFYYLPVLLIGLMPHTAFLLKAASSLRFLWKSPVNRFGLIWFGFVLVFFSLAATKLHHYIVYGYPPLLLMMAQVVNRVRRPGTIIAWPAVFTLLLTTIPLVISVVPRFTTDDFAKYVLSDIEKNTGWESYWAAFLVFVLYIILFRLKRLTRPVLVFFSALIFGAMVNLWLIPLVGDIMQSPIKESAQLAKNRQLDVIMWQTSYPSFSFYLGHSLANRPPVPGDVVITKRTKLDMVKRHEIIYEKNGIVMTRILEMTP